jgi:hypothetical protein
MQAHGGEVLNAMRLEVVYIGFEGEDGSPSFDVFLDWLLASDYWGILRQYGVNAGSRVGSVRIPRSAIIPEGLAKNGLIDSEDMDSLLWSAIEGFSPSMDGGADAATDGGPRLLPEADAYVFFLPNGVNVSLGNRGGHVFQTCTDAGGYHTAPGTRPFAVIPPCSDGRSALSVSHELAEMATDPFPGRGWYSDKDVQNAGGEIGDLCNEVVRDTVEGWSVTQLWSNADGDCEPN